MYRSRSYPQVALRPQDLVVLLRLSLEAGVSPSYAALASELFLTASEIHAGLERAAIAQLVRKDSRGKVTLVREALRSFVLHGATFHPLYPTVPQAAERNPALHERVLAMERLEGLLSSAAVIPTSTPHEPSE